MNRCFQWRIVHIEIMSTFHAWVEYISVLKICHSNHWEWKTPKPPLPLWAHGPPSNAPISQLTPLTTLNDSLISSHTSAQLCNKIPIGYNGTSKIHPQNCPSPLTIMTPIYYTYPWPPQMASGSNQQFSHNTLSRPTVRLKDRLTDGIDDRALKNRAYTLLYWHRAMC